MKFLASISKLAGDYFILLVILFSAAGFLFPYIFLWTIPYIPLFLGIIMFAMGMTLSTADFVRILQQPKGVMAGVFSQYLIMPMAAFVIVKILDIDSAMAVGIILVGTCPGGTASNVITYLSKGDVALSVSITSVSTIISPFITPLLTLLLAGQWISIPALSMFVTIIQIVFLPVLAGIFLNHFFHKQVKIITHILPLFSVIAIIIIIAGIVSVNRPNIISINFLPLAAVVIHNITGLAWGYGAARLLGFDSNWKRTLSIEVGMQNSGLAVTLALLHFNPIAAIPAAVFSIWHNISGSVLATYWSRKSIDEI